MHHAISAPNAAAPGQLVAMAVDEARLLPPPVQQPRPPVWVAAMSDNPGPYERAAHWDGVGAHEGFDPVAAAAPSVAAAEYEEPGATRQLESYGYDRDRLDGLHRRVLDGPPA